jgi:pimeloyl-ACP methyl ester carboxylesterase
MNDQAWVTGNLERRIRDAERELFDAVGAEVDESVLDLAQTGLRVRVLSHGRGPAVVLLHGVSESAAIWAPLFTELVVADAQLAQERHAQHRCAPRFQSGTMAGLPSRPLLRVHSLRVVIDREQDRRHLWIADVALIRSP